MCIECGLIEQNVDRATGHAGNAEKWAKQLQGVITYIRTNHVGMIRGDGDLTRYMSYLVMNVVNETGKAKFQLDHCKEPGDLPF